MFKEKLLQKTKEELTLRNYSRRTIDNYLFCIKKYFEFNVKKVDSFSSENVREFLLSLHEKRKAPQTINLHLNAIRFFYREILKKPIRTKIKMSRKNKRLPVVLSRKEISNIINQIINLKHSFFLLQDLKKSLFYFL